MSPRFPVVDRIGRISAPLERLSNRPAFLLMKNVERDQAWSLEFLGNSCYNVQLRSSVITTGAISVLATRDWRCG